MANAHPSGQSTRKRVLELLGTGISETEISKRIEVSRQRVNQIVNGKRAVLKAGRPAIMLTCPHCSGPFKTGDLLSHIPHCRKNPRRKKRSKKA